MNSLENIYKQHINDLYRYLFQLSGNPEIAEDLVQDTFLKAYDHLESYKGENIRPWLYRVAHNSYIDWYRKEKRNIPTDPKLISTINCGSNPSLEEWYLAKEKLTDWFIAVRELPERQRHIILLRDYHELSYQEIANILDMTLANVKVLLYRSRQRIKEVMKDEL